MPSDDESACELPSAHVPTHFLQFDEDASTESWPALCLSSDDHSAVFESIPLPPRSLSPAAAATQPLRANINKDVPVSPVASIPEHAPDGDDDGHLILLHTSSIDASHAVTSVLTSALAFEPVASFSAAEPVPSFVAFAADPTAVVGGAHTRRRSAADRTPTVSPAKHAPRSPRTRRASVASTPTASKSEPKRRAHVKLIEEAVACKTGQRSAPTLSVSEVAKRLKSIAKDAPLPEEQLTALRQHWAIRVGRPSSHCEPSLHLEEDTEEMLQHLIKKRALVHFMPERFSPAPNVFVDNVLNIVWQARTIDTQKYMHDVRSILVEAQLSKTAELAEPCLADFDSLIIAMRRSYQNKANQKELRKRKQAEVTDSDDEPPPRRRVRRS